MGHGMGQQILPIWFSPHKVRKTAVFVMKTAIFGASVLIGLLEKRCHTIGFSDFRVADFLVFTLEAVTEMPKSTPTSR